MKLLGISGKAGSGKDTVYSIINNLRNCPFLVYRRAFADNLKHEVAEALDITEQHLDTIKQSIRPLLQTWADAKKVLHGEDYYLKKLSYKLSLFKDSSNCLIVITDVRFKFEADYIKQLGGQLWRIERAGLDPRPFGQHASETELDNYEGFNIVIENNDGLLELTNKVMQSFNKSFLL